MLVVAFLVLFSLLASCDPKDKASSQATLPATVTAPAHLAGSPAADASATSSASAASSTSPSATPTPAATSAPAEPALAGDPASTTRATDLLATVAIKGRAPKTGYDRAAFGQQWYDLDRNGCDTRNDILRRDLIDITLKDGTNGCVVLSGTLHDPYTATTIAFQRGQGTSNAVEIDHVVALSDAWQKGAQQFSEARRTALANDPLNLLAVDGPANQKKSDGDAATWLPPNKSFRCAYVARQTAVKAKYGLWMTQAEHDAIARILEACPDQTVPDSAVAEPANQPEPPAEVTPAEPAAEPEPVAPAAPAEDSCPGGDYTGNRYDGRCGAAPVPVAAPAPVEAAPQGGGLYFKNCTQARKAGAAPLYRGQPGYRPELDRDNDGVACEG